MYQQWLQVIGLVFDGAGFALIALEWFRGYVEMRKKVTLVARNQEQAEKIRLRKELKDAIGNRPELARSKRSITTTRRSPTWPSTSSR